MAFEYKCVAAPERAKRKRGTKTRTERVALAMEEIIEREATDGWEYMRTDLVPVEERSGLFGRPMEVHRAILVFRRGGPASRRFLSPPDRSHDMQETLPPGDYPQTAPDRPVQLAAAHEPLPTEPPAPSIGTTPKGLG